MKRLYLVTLLLLAALPIFAQNVLTSGSGSCYSCRDWVGCYDMGSPVLFCGYLCEYGLTECTSHNPPGGVGPYFCEMGGDECQVALDRGALKIDGEYRPPQQATPQFVMDRIDTWLVEQRQMTMAQRDAFRDQVDALAGAGNDPQATALRLALYRTQYLVLTGRNLGTGRYPVVGKNGRMRVPPLVASN